MKATVALYPRPNHLRSNAPWVQHRLAVEGLCPSRVLDGVGRYSGGITVGEARPSALGVDRPLDDGLAQRRRGWACRLARADAVTLLAEYWSGREEPWRERC